MYFVLSAFTSSPFSLLATAKASSQFSIVRTLPMGVKLGRSH